MAEDLNTPDALADVLRNSAAWLKAAADKLEAGDLDGAHDMAKLGAFGTEDIVGRINRLRAAAISASLPCDDCGADQETPCACPTETSR